MTRWRVSLSNGECFNEGIAPFDEVSGELSPWLKLQLYLEHDKLSIRSLSLIAGRNNFHLPSSGTNPRFKAFSDAPAPEGYNFFRMYGQDQGSKPEVYAVIEALYNDKTVQLWVDEHNPFNCWVLTK